MWEGYHFWRGECQQKGWFEIERSGQKELEWLSLATILLDEITLPGDEPELNLNYQSVNRPDFEYYADLVKEMEDPSAYTCNPISISVQLFDDKPFPGHTDSVRSEPIATKVVLAEMRKCIIAMKRDASSAFTEGQAKAALQDHVKNLAGLFRAFIDRKVAITIGL